MDSWIMWPEVGGAVAVGGALWALRWAAADFVLDRFGDVWTDRMHGGQRVTDGRSEGRTQRVTSLELARTDGRAS